ncbi:MAG: TenA family protein, partial [Proteobacteria bacterium]|nr:TenA family protein [Pseudomonadota bacterium]
LKQDYLFLIHFARAYALAAYKSETLSDIRQAAAGLSAIIDLEMTLHIEFCAGWGIDETALAREPEAPECMAYTRYVLERGMAGDLLDLHVALAPCIVGYGEIAMAIREDPATMTDANPYQAWIDMYLSEEYRTAVAEECAQLDRLMETRGGAARFDALAKTFGEATRLESAFWQMGLDAAKV